MLDTYILKKPDRGKSITQVPGDCDTFDVSEGAHRAPSLHLREGLSGICGPKVPAYS